MNVNTIKIVSISIALLFVYACSHPIEIVGQGDVTSTGARGCTFEESIAGTVPDNCAKNLVIGAYQETYYPTPRPGWEFDSWENYCANATPPNYGCSFNIAAAVVRQFWGQAVPPLRALFKIPGQQQWASQYVSWSFTNPPSNVYNVDQQVWIPQKNTASFWPMQFGFLPGGNSGAYVGLQLGDGEGNVRFSIWNATEAVGSDCRPFGGEGIGYTCTVPVNIDQNTFYRVRMWKLASATDGEWWGAWLLSDNGGYKIGEIKAPLGNNFIDPHSISNFVEYFGWSVPRCRSVPQSQAAFSPPFLNYQGGGVYGGSAQYNDSIKAAGNICTEESGGVEERGALITPIPYDFYVPNLAQGVRVFLGGEGGASHTIGAVPATPPSSQDWPLSGPPPFNWVVP